MFMKNKKVVVFDLDGTLIQSSINFVKMKNKMIEILEQNGVPIDLFTPQQTTVVILAGAERIWNKLNMSKDRKARILESLEEAMNNVELEAISEIEEINGTLTTLVKLRDMGFKLVILTRSHHEYAVKALKIICAYNCFDLVLGRGETPKPKPYAESLEFIAKQLDVSLDEVMFVGDNHIDALTAENAGCTFIGVRTGPRGDESWAGTPPDILIDSIKQLIDLIE